MKLTITYHIEEDIDLNMHLIINVPATFIIRVQGKFMVDVGFNDELCIALYD